jgi:hypothetical protein
MSIALALLAPEASAADEPCYGHTFEQRVSTEHYWVEWDGNVLDETKAMSLAEAAEHAAETYRDMGWLITDEPVVIAAIQQGSGISGLTRTTDCDSGPVPRVDLFIGDYDSGSAIDVTSHEIAHVAQYAYMGAYEESVASWLWWMESSATWLTPHADGLWTGWGDTASDYLAHPELGMHHGLEGFLDPEISDHMYATTYVTATLAEFAGEDAVRATWEYGADHTGDVIFFPDAVTAAGVDFDAYWAWHLASMPTKAIERGNYVGEPFIAETSGALPSDGSGAPEGFGVQITRFPSSLGAKKSSLNVTFDGDPTIPWRVVLVRTTGGAIVDYVEVPVTDGHAEGWISGFSRVDGWLVASPGAIERTPRAYTWSAELGDDQDPMPGAVTLGEAPEDGGCDHTGGTGAVAPLLGAIALVRRSTSAASSRRPSRSSAAVASS